MERETIASSHRPRALAWVLLLAPVVLILVYPLAQDYLKAASLLARVADPGSKSWIAGYDVHPVDSGNNISFQFNGNSVPALVVRPLGMVESAGMVLLVPGARVEGIGVPALKFARALAETGYSVMVPQLGHATELGADQDSAELVARSAAAFAEELKLRKVGMLAPPALAGIAAFASNTPEGSRSIEWVIAGEPIATALQNPRRFSQLSLRERLALVHWLSLLIREARNSPASKSRELPAGCWVRTHGAASQSIPW